MNCFCNLFGDNIIWIIIIALILNQLCNSSCGCPTTNNDFGCGCGCR